MSNEIFSLCEASHQNTLSIDPTVAYRWKSLPTPGLDDNPRGLLEKTEKHKQRQTITLPLSTERESAPTNGRVQRRYSWSGEGLLHTARQDREREEALTLRVCVCVWVRACLVCALNSPGLCMRSSSLTERALTTPPAWTRKPGGKDVKVKKGNSCKFKNNGIIHWNPTRVTNASLVHLGYCWYHIKHLFLANALPQFHVIQIWVC